MHDAVRAPGLGIPADGIRVGDVELGAAGREDIDVVPGEDLDDVGADEPRASGDQHSHSLAPDGNPFHAGVEEDLARLVGQLKIAV